MRHSLTSFRLDSSLPHSRDGTHYAKCRRTPPSKSTSMVKQPRPVEESPPTSPRRPLLAPHARPSSPAGLVKEQNTARATSHTLALPFALSHLHLRPSLPVTRLQKYSPPPSSPDQLPRSITPIRLRQCLRELRIKYTRCTKLANHRQI